jgi:hypothetical protein
MGDGLSSVSEIDTVSRRIVGWSKRGDMRSEIVFVTHLH